jgi:NADP-dependent 3-hydroxy acid dehydrogenase YdfG
MADRSQQVWFITGASAGFGREITKAVLAAGGRVFATARHPADLADLAAGADGRLIAHSLDVTKRDEIHAAVAAANAAFGGIDVLVNNAGYGLIASVEEAHEADYARMFAVNLYGPLDLIRAILPGMRAQRRGWIVNISSIAGRTSVPGGAFYSASKYALEGLSDGLRMEVEPLGIGVTVVEPGAFRTDFAGRSLVIGPPGHPDYAATVGRFAEILPSYDGKQPGDPAKAAAAILAALDHDKPPRQLLLGSDALGSIEPIVQAQREEIDRWRTLSLGTDFTS